ncbi:MAG TPA: hypothetical protein VN625_01650, partial [Desulfuromonadaceae bacterium]|nr:hypothetical protein [Desulfuromonadaceae bacterium]
MKRRIIEAIVFCRRPMLLFFTMAAACQFGAANVSAADGIWSLDNNGAWGTNANWLNNTIASGVDSTAYFTNAITASRNVTNETSRTIGNLVVNTIGNVSRFNLVSTPGSVLTLSTASGNPTITVNTNLVNVNCVLAGTQGFVKNGVGGMVLFSNNT